MCKAESKKGYEHPEKLKGKPEECAPEQIRECHGEVVEHPCIEKEHPTGQTDWEKVTENKGRRY